MPDNASFLALEEYDFILPGEYINSTIAPAIV